MKRLLAAIIICTAATTVAFAQWPSFPNSPAIPKPAGGKVDLKAPAAKADPKTLDPQIMHNLIWILMPLTFTLGIAATLVLLFYRIDKGAHEMNLAKLAAQTASGE